MSVILTPRTESWGKSWLKLKAKTSTTSAEKLVSKPSIKHAVSQSIRSKRLQKKFKYSKSMIAKFKLNTQPSYELYNSKDCYHTVIDIYSVR